MIRPCTTAVHLADEALIRRFRDDGLEHALGHGGPADVSCAHSLSMAAAVVMVGGLSMEDDKIFNSYLGKQTALKSSLQPYRR